MKLNISFDNFVGHYRFITCAENSEYSIRFIVSEEVYDNKEQDGVEIKKKPIQLNINNDLLLMQLANIDLNNDKEILNFCNKNGLPVSSTMVREQNDRKYMLLNVDFEPNSNLDGQQCSENDFDLKSIDLNNDKDILNFCNKNGVPVSSTMVLEQNDGKHILLNVDFEAISNSDFQQGSENDFDLRPYDHVSLIEFSAYVYFARDLLLVFQYFLSDKKRLKKKAKTYTDEQTIHANFFRAFYTLLFFSFCDNGCIVMPEKDKHFDIFQLQKKLTDYHVNKCIKKYKKTKLDDISIQTLINFSQDVLLNSETQKYRCLLDLFVEIVNYKDNASHISLKDNRILVEDGFTVRENQFNKLISFSKSLFISILNEWINVSKLTLFFDNESQRFCSKLDSFYLYTALFVELWYSLSSGLVIQKCGNPKCGKFFCPSRESNVFCSDHCRKRMENIRHRKKKQNT